MSKFKQSLINKLHYFDSEFHKHFSSIYSFFSRDRNSVGNAELDLTHSKVRHNLMEIDLNTPSDCPINPGTSGLRLNEIYKNILIGEAFECIKIYCGNSTDKNNELFRGSIMHPYIQLLRYLQVLYDGDHVRNNNLIRWHYRFNSVTWNRRTISKGARWNDADVPPNEVKLIFRELLEFVHKELE